MVFQCAGVANAGTQEQLKSFFHTLRRYDKSVSTIPSDWIDAFEMLISYLDSLSQKRKVVFIDELPWMDTPGAHFVSHSQICSKCFHYPITTNLMEAAEQVE